MQVCLGWDVLSTMPIMSGGYVISDLETGCEKLPVVRRLSTIARQSLRASGDGTALQMFESRLVYRHTHADVTAGAAPQTCNRVSGFRLVYGLRLELPAPSRALQDLGEAVWSDDAPLRVPSKHVTQQGFDCGDVARAVHREEQEDDEASLLSGSFRRRLPRCAPGEAPTLRRLRLAITDVYVKRSGPSHSPALTPVQAGCLVTWRGQVMSTLVVSASPLSRAERDSTCYLPLGGDGEVHDLSVVVIAQPGGSADATAAAEEGCSGVAFLPWDRLRRLPWNRTDYVVTSGDEQLCDRSTYVSLQLETLRDVPTQEAGSGPTHVRELGGMVVRLKLCLETSRPNRPFMLELQPLRAEALALCNEWGAARLPGKRQRRVYATIKHGTTLWHTTTAVLGEENGEVDLAGPMAALPLLHDAAELTVSLHDFGHYSPMEAATVVRIQKLARCWIARRRVALLRVKKRIRWQQWRAATSIACAARRWVQVQRRVKAAVVLQRAMRGYVQRRLLRTLLRTSTMAVRLMDLRYVSVEDDSLDGLVCMRCVVAWNGAVIATHDLDVTLRDGCDLSAATGGPLACVLKRVLHDERLLCHTVGGREYYLVDRAVLSLTLVKRAAAFAYLSPDWHVARLVLDAHDLAKLCHVSSGDGPAPPKTNFTLSFETVQGGEGITQDEVVRRVSLSSAAGRLLQPPPRVSCPNQLVLGLAWEAKRPLWDHGRASQEDQPEAAEEVSEGQALATAVVDELLSKVLLLARSRMLTLRVAGFKDLPKIGGGASSGGRKGSSSGGGLSPSCLVAWEGTTLATIKLAYQETTATWTPALDQPSPASQPPPSDPSSPDVFLPLPRPTATNPEAMVLLYHEGLHGKVLLATATLSLDDLLELRRTGARQVAGRGAWASSLVDVVLDPSNAQRKKESGGGSASRLPSADLGVYFTASPATSGSDGVQRRRSSLSNTQRRSSVGRRGTDSALVIVPSSERRASSKPEEESTALVLVAPVHADEDHDDKEATEPAEGAAGGGGDGGSIWATAGGTAVNIMGSVSSRRPAKLDFDEERQLFFFVNDKGNRVYQIPKRALAPPTAP